MSTFEQSSRSPFGQTNSVFGLNNSSDNPFAPKPFGSQTDSSIFGSTSTGVFGAAPTPSPFGASCSPAFGSSMPAFGSSSTPAFGSSSTSFGGSSGFGQKPAFGGFGSTIPTSIWKQLETVGGFGSTVKTWKHLEATQTNPFGSATQPSQPAFGSSIFGFSTTRSLEMHPDPVLVSSTPMTEEDGGISEQTAKLESISAMPTYKFERFE